MLAAVVYGAIIAFICFAFGYYIGRSKNVFCNFMIIIFPKINYIHSW